jgi:hypothetical protein
VRLAGRRLQLPRRSGAAVTAAQAHPNVLGALSALHDLVDQYQWLADLLEPGTPDRRSRPAAGGDGRRFGRAVEYLRVGLRLIDPTLAGLLGTDLNAAAQLAAQATGAAPVRQDFGHGACPACGRRSLVAQTISTADPAIITCTRPDCRCRGIDCLCRRPLRTTGLRHIWPSDEFGQLRAVLDRQQVAA